MYAKVLENIVNAQFGFWKEKGCIDANFTLRQICDEAMEHDKVFDRVDKNKLWHTLEDCGVKDHRLDNTKVLYENGKTCVRTSKGNNVWFSVTSGLKQGCVLSPQLFTVYVVKRQMIILDD